MQLDIISYHDLIAPEKNPTALASLKKALLNKGIVGVSHVPHFEEISQNYINAARAFSALPDAVKLQYAPNRAAKETEGYELGAEWFQNQKDEWQIDDKKASFYAIVPDAAKNIWPKEVDLKTPYLALGNLIFATGKIVLKAIGLDEVIGIQHDGLDGYGRMLHYHKENDLTNENPDWCGGHFDHGIFTGLIPAYYFQDGVEKNEPAEAGLYIKPHDSDNFEKINADDKSILLFQVGEFGQLASNDQIQATKHIVKKTKGGIERFTFALFFNAADDTVIQSTSRLINDARYANNKAADGSISYHQWSQASFAQYEAKK